MHCCDHWDSFEGVFSLRTDWPGWWWEGGASQLWTHTVTLRNWCNGVCIRGGGTNFRYNTVYLTAHTPARLKMQRCWSLFKCLASSYWQGQSKGTVWTEDQVILIGKTTKSCIYRHGCVLNNRAWVNGCMILNIWTTNRVSVASNMTTNRSVTEIIQTGLQCATRYYTRVIVIGEPRISRSPRGAIVVQQSSATLNWR